jgi:hypothetical protein
MAYQSDNDTGITFSQIGSCTPHIFSIPEFTFSDLELHLCGNVEMFSEVILWRDDG